MTLFSAPSCHRKSSVVTGPADPFVIPAGFACAFDVGVVYSDTGHGAITDFGDGGTAIFGVGEATITNLDTGAFYVQRSRVRALETYDPVANDVLVQVSGRFYFFLVPGDQGPSGVVGEPGVLFSIGSITYTYDIDTDFVTSTSLVGQATDICEEIS